MIPTLHALLLDFDGLLADYDHPRHLRHLAEAAGCAPAQIDALLRGEGLELAHARGELDGGALLQALNARLGSQLSADDWRAARIRASALRRDALALLQRLRADVRVAVLTNNGPPERGRDRRPAAWHRGAVQRRAGRAQTRSAHLPGRD